MNRKYLILMAGAAAAILIVVGILIIRRDSPLEPVAKAQRYPHQHLSSSEWEPVAKLTDVSYKLREGDSLANTATLRYGHQKYYSVIKLYNHIENEAAVAAGTTLRLPDISTILNEEGFTKVAASEMELILCSRAKYDKVKGPFWDLRRERPLRERVVVPQQIKQELLEAADDLEQATQSLKANKPGRRPPLKMIGQLESAMWGMRELAEGSNDGYGYDIDMVQQRYALGLTYGIILRMTAETLKIILTIISGICWTIVYIDGIRLGIKDKSYAIPFYALALNFAWEVLYTYFGFRINGVNVQNIFSALWLTFDIGILYTYFKFGKKYFPGWNPPADAGGNDEKQGPPAMLRTPTPTLSQRERELSAGGSDKTSVFIGWSTLVLVTAFAIEYSIVREFGVAKGAPYSAFSQNLLMSVLFIGMLVQRGNREGQSMTIAVNKWLGTLAPAIVYGVLGEGGFPRGSFLILVLGILCSVFDLIYIRLLARAR